MKFNKISALLEDKNILILGFGKEGKSTLSFITDFIKVKSVTVADKNDVSKDVPLGVSTQCGECYADCLEKYDVIIKSPGVVYTNPTEEILAKTTSQTDLFLREFNKQTIGITGTKGKSTTTTLIHHIMQNSGIDAVLTGNIGIPPLDSARSMNETSVAVFEMSCHQLEFLRISPKIAVVLNLFEDHLDHYGTRENYVRAKENIFLHQSEDCVLVISEECSEQIGKAVSLIKEMPVKPSYDYSGMEMQLIGEHNYYNISVAKTVTELFGISDTDFYNGLKTYRTLPHRLEYVATKNGVEYYDDSISTVCRTTIQAITSLKTVDTVIIGGMDRGIDYTELVDFLEQNPVRNIVLAYESGRRIAGMLNDKGVSYILAEDLADAVRISADKTQKGSRCVMSPAAASYGYFKNFEERGDVFKELVNKL